LDAGHGGSGERGGVGVVAQLAAFCHAVADLDPRDGHPARCKLGGGVQQGAIERARRRLPANPTTRRTSFDGCSAMPASSTEERESLCAFHARLEVFAYRQHLRARQRLHVPLETHNRHLAGPARRVFHLGPPDECHCRSLRCSRTACQQYQAATVR